MSFNDNFLYCTLRLRSSQYLHIRLRKHMLDGYWWIYIGRLWAISCQIFIIIVLIIIIIIEIIMMVIFIIHIGLVEWIRISFQFVAHRHRSSQLYILHIIFEIHHFLDLSLKVGWVLCCVRVKCYILIMYIIVSKSMVIIDSWSRTHGWIDIVIVLIIVILIIFILSWNLVVVSLRSLWYWFGCYWTSCRCCIIFRPERKIYYLWF